MHENGQKTSECIEDVCVNIDKRIIIFTELHMQNTILKIQMLTKLFYIINSLFFELDSRSKPLKMQ